MKSDIGLTNVSAQPVAYQHIQEPLENECLDCDRPKWTNIENFSHDPTNTGSAQGQLRHSLKRRENYLSKIGQLVLKAVFGQFESNTQDLNAVLLADGRRTPSVK